MSAKPAGYPLAWCETLDMPYWQINVTLRCLREGWRGWQSGRSMAGIITQIDALIATQPPEGHPDARPHRNGES